jgi:ketosteroid isomerase-like protein
MNEAHAAITNRIARYAKALDDRDFDTVGACFTPDAQVSYSGVALPPGRQAIMDYLQGLRSLIATTHIMSVPVIDLDGDRAHVETSGLAFLVVPTAGEPVVRTRGLRYADEFVLADGEWLIARRVHRCDWMYEGPLSPTTKAT